MSPAIVGRAPTQPCSSVAVSGMLAYVISSGRLWVIGVWDPASPVFLASVETPGEAQDVAVSGRMAYVADGSSGLTVVDVSSPTSPAILGSVSPISGGGVAVSGSAAYLVCGYGCFSAFVTVPIQCPSQEVVNVDASGFAPGNVTIPPDGQITWVRIAGNHTTTSGTGPLDPKAGTLWDGVLQSNSRQFVHMFPKSGTFPYFCRNHPSETGTISVSGTIGIAENVGPSFHLTASPNPFSTAVDLHFNLERAGHMSVIIVDLAGRKVRDLVAAEFPAGPHRLTWEGRDEQHHPVGPGLYFARIVGDDGRVEAQKLFKMR